MSWITIGTAYKPLANFQKSPRSNRRHGTVWVVDAKYVKDYQIWLRFNDNPEKVVDFKDKIFSEKRKMFTALQNIEYFKKVTFNQESDTIQWPNGVDIAPERLYAM